MHESNIIYSNKKFAFQGEINDGITEKINRH